ncbi:non-ribosomal peptide synthetase [Methyloversatilis thermotolerans]|uniref:non-ribosomal peptide synthetase n=1 Tax=Methyloversatilis thermotolerans TaxID=1346290 RepID=UPI00037B75C2|nr:non-ribosomal peptide synthetase [Methyloversatilis thermotolerans]
MSSGSRPDLASLRARMAALSPAQQALLREQLAARGIALDEAPAALALDELPLSPAQGHLWVVHQLQPEGSAYHIAPAWTLHGELDRDALAAALQVIADRHQALRCEFFERDGAPRQRVRDSVHWPLLQESCDGQALDARLRTLAAAPFDLAQAPLARAHLIRLSATRHVLLLVLHHLIADGWSRGVLLRELGECYGALRAGRAPGLPAPAGDLAGHLQAQQRWLDSAECARQVDYWRGQLAGVAPLDLPTDSARSPASGYASRTVSCTVPAGLRDALQRAARQAGATPFMLLLALYMALLHRYSGRDDIAVGIPVAGRRPLPGGPDPSGLIGFFVNTLVIRARPRRASWLGDWLDAVRQSVAEAFDHADVPFARVVEQCGVARDASRTPLFETMFQYQGEGYRAQNAELISAGDSAQGEGGFGGLRVEQGWVELAHTKFDLSWHVLERESGLLLAIEYRSALFEHARIEAMLGHFRRLLEAALPALAARSPLHLGGVDLLSDDEAAWLARTRQCPRPPRPIPLATPWRSVVQRFDEQVARTPDAVAADAPACEALSYRALQRRSAQFAHRLIALGVRPEARVGLCLPRRPELMVALLGTLRAGAAYVPLDPVLPDERLRYMCEDAGIAVLVTTREHVARLYGGAPPCPVLCLDDADHLAALDAESDALPARALHPQQLAYCIYTSGSTGRPKGTLLSHAGLMHYLDWCLAAYPVGEGRGAPVNSSIGFDATITGLYAPLLVGGCVMLLPESDPLATLVDALSAGYSLVKLTPAHLSALQPLVDSAGLAPDARLPGAFVIGGEALTEAHIAFWRSRFPQIQLINEYGPTETVVGCCYYRASEADHGPVPIGYPISGATLHLLDAYMNPVPQGMAGEIFIGGTGMARGYLNRAALSAERFLPDPFASQPGAVMYRTGDLAVQRADGMVTYLGRADQQLQLRGFRIEPGEIESALCRLPEVAEAVAGVRDLAGGPALIAHVRLHAAGTDVASLRTRIAQWLPSYMLPSHIVAVDAFPLTPNGKVDRGALPLPEVAAVGGAAASSDAERRLLEIWRAVLGRDDIGVQDNFFEAGGDSVSAMQIVARARSAGLVLAPADLFEHQTVAAQAMRAQPAVHEEVAEAVGEVPLSPLQRAFLAAVDAGAQPQPSHYNQSVLLDVDPAVDDALLARVFAALVHRHPSLRLRYRRGDDGWVQTFAALDAQCGVPFEVCATADDEALQSTMTGLQRALDIEHGPTMRAALCRSGDGRARLFIAAHHLVIDGLSWRLLLTDLAECHAALAAGGEMPPAPVAPHYGQWTAALQALRPQFETDAAYWRSARAAALPLPGEGGTGYERDAVTTVCELDETATEALLGEVATRLQAGVDALLLTAAAQAIAQWLHRDTLVFDIESHGRQRIAPTLPDMSRTVGWFTTISPVRIELPHAAPRVQLAAVRSALAAAPLQGPGHGLLDAAGALDGLPRSEMSVNYLGRIETAGGFIRALAPDTVPEQRHPDALRSHALELIALVREGRLQMLWRHVPQRLPVPLVESLARRVQGNLLGLIADAQGRAPATAESAPAPARAAKPDAAQALLAKLKAGRP